MRARIVHNGCKNMARAHMRMVVTAHSEPDKNENMFIEKLALFREKFGNDFYLILLVPPQFYEYVKVQYSGRHAYDELRLVDDVPARAQIEDTSLVMGGGSTSATTGFEPP